MELTDLTKLAKEQNIIPSRKIIDKALELENNNQLKFDGTFETIYKAVKENIIKPLTVNNRIVGISYNANANSIEEDNIASYNFSKAYASKPVEEYCLLAMQLTTAGLEPDKIVENDYGVFCYILGKGLIIDGYGNQVAKLKDEEIAKYNYKEDIIEALDNLLDAAIYEEYEEEEEEYEEDDDDLPIDDEDTEPLEEDSELPNYAFILKSELKENYTKEDIKDYLRNKYNHYLAKDTDIRIVEMVDKLYITDIQWGRKK